MNHANPSTEKTCELTPTERKVMTHLREAWRASFQLDDHQFEEVDQVRNHIHAIECLMAHRLAKRVCSEFR